MQVRKRVQLDQLAERVRAVEAAGSVGGGCARRVATGWPAVDAALGGGLVAGGVHEWVADGREGSAQGAGPHKHLSPLALLIHLARGAMGGHGLENQGGWGVWIGRSCFVYPHGLVSDDDAVLERTLWVDPPDRAGRLWAIDLATRCAGVAVVVADGSALDMAATRRLQLAAEVGGTVVLLTRPAAERKTLSAATTRWTVRPSVSETSWPRWEIELSRCKGVQRGTGREGQHAWRLEGKYERGQGLVVIPAESGDRSAAAVAHTPTPKQRRA